MKRSSKISSLLVAAMITLGVADSASAAVYVGPGQSCSNYRMGPFCAPGLVCMSSALSFGFGVCQPAYGSGYYPGYNPGYNPGWGGGGGGGWGGGRGNGWSPHRPHHGPHHGGCR